MCAARIYEWRKIDRLVASGSTANCVIESGHEKGHFPFGRSYYMDGSFWAKSGEIEKSFRVGSSYYKENIDEVPWLKVTIVFDPESPEKTAMIQGSGGTRVWFWVACALVLIGYFGGRMTSVRESRKASDPSV